MSTQSNQSNNEIKNEIKNEKLVLQNLFDKINFACSKAYTLQVKLVEEKVDKVWCECGEHFCNRDDHWVSVHPTFGDCMECCSEKECKELLEEDSEFDLEDTTEKVRK